jgi:SAM-dependent methyltransferase
MTSPGANRRHWEDVGRSYSASWEPPAKRRLSELELDFVRRFVPKKDGGVTLDVGCGNGRIMAAVLAAAPTARAFGIDVAEEMVRVCRERFKDERRVAGLFVCDVARQPLPVDERFDVITAIRVLKYSENWSDVVGVLLDALAPDGTLVLSIPNRNSLNRFSRPYAVPWYSATQDQVETAVTSRGGRVLDVAGFARLPYALYERLPGRPAAAAVTGTERVLSAALGSRLLVRELFFAATRTRDAAR